LVLQLPERVQRSDLTWSGVRRRRYRSLPAGHVRMLAASTPEPGTIRWDAAMHPGQPSGVVHPPGQRL